MENSLSQSLSTELGVPLTIEHTRLIQTLKNIRMSLKNSLNQVEYDNDDLANSDYPMVLVALNAMSTAVDMIDDVLEQ